MKPSCFPILSIFDPLQNPQLRPRQLIAALSTGLLLVAGLMSVSPSAAAQTPHRVGQTFSLAADRVQHTDHGLTSAVVLSAYNTEGWASVIDETWQPSFAMSPQFHKVHSETWYVVSGETQWTVGGKTRTLGANDAVHIPPFTAFSAKVTGDQPARLIRIYQPGGYEITQAYVRKLTTEQRKDPKIAAALAFASDLYPATDEMPKVVDRPYTKYFNLRKTRKTYQDDGTSDPAVTSIDGGGLLNLQEEYWEPNFYVGPHFHNTKTETFIVLGGRVEWTVGGESHIMSTGDAVHIPSNTVHTARELDGRPLHTLLFYQPYGYDRGLQFRDSLTPEQQKDPVFQETQRTITDFNRVQQP